MLCVVKMSSKKVKVKHIHAWMIYIIKYNKVKVQISSDTDRKNYYDKFITLYYGSKMVRIGLLYKNNNNQRFSDLYPDGDLCYGVYDKNNTYNGYNTFTGYNAPIDGMVYMKYAFNYDYKTTEFIDKDEYITDMNEIDEIAKKIEIIINKLMLYYSINV